MPDDKLSLLKEGLGKIIEKAKQDGNISLDEQQIVDKVTMSIEKYEEYLNSAKDDGIIDQGELNKLHELEEEILSGAYFTAMSDDELTEDEYLLLKTLMQVVYPHADISWLDTDRT